MASLDDLNAAATAATQAVADLVARAQAAEAAVPDFQPVVDQLNQAAAQAQAYLNPPPPAA